MIKTRRKTMIIKTLKYGDTDFEETECDDFEFRTNHVANWIRFFKDGTQFKIIHDVCVIKTIK
jgi:hypothetical protein